MKTENYAYKGGVVNLKHHSGGCAFLATYKGDTIASGVEVSKGAAKRECETRLSNFVHKPYAHRSSFPHKPPVKKIKPITHQETHPSFKEPTPIWPCPIACQWPNGSPERIRHIEYCDECRRREIAMNKSVNRPNAPLVSGVKHSSEQTKRIMSMKKALDTDDKETQKKHVQRILGEEWNKDV